MLDTDYPYFPATTNETAAKRGIRARIAALFQKLRNALRCRRSAL